MFPDFRNVFTFDLTFEDVATRFIVALLCGLLVSVFYRWSYRGTSYSSSFVVSLISLSMITASVIMVIGNNLARAFGLVGAMSIIRFRTAVKDSTDIVFIFFALAMGLAAGVGLHVVAITGSVFIGLVVWLLTLANYAVPTKREYLLQFTYSPLKDDEPGYLEVLRRHCKRFKLVNVKSVGESGSILELSYYIVPKRPEFTAALVRDLGAVRGVEYANLFFDEAEV